MNKNHDPKNGEFSSGPSTDMAIVNVPLSKRGDINAQLDKYKRDQAAQVERKRKEYSQTKKDAKTLLAEHGQMIFEKHQAKFGPKLKDELKRMATWEPNKFIKLVDNFKSGK